MTQLNLNNLKSVTSTDQTALAKKSLGIDLPELGLFDLHLDRARQSTTGTSHSGDRAHNEVDSAVDPSQSPSGDRPQAAESRPPTDSNETAPADESDESENRQPDSADPASEPADDKKSAEINDTSETEDTDQSDEQEGADAEDLSEDAAIGLNVAAADPQQQSQAENLEQGQQQAAAEVDAAEHQAIVPGETETSPATESDTGTAHNDVEIEVSETADTDTDSGDDDPSRRSGNPVAATHSDEVDSNVDGVEHTPDASSSARPRRETSGSEAGDSQAGRQQQDGAKAEPAQMEAQADSLLVQELTEHQGLPDDSKTDPGSAATDAGQPQPGDASGEVVSTGGNSADAGPTGRLAESLAARAVSKTAVQRAPANDQADRVQFVRRVANAFQTAAARGESIRMRLHPAQLGSLQLELSVRGGVLTARIETESSTARNMLLDNLPALRERLAEQDIKVARFDVDLGDRSSGGSPQGPPENPQSQDRTGQGTSHASKRPEEQPDDKAADDGVRSPSRLGQFDVTI